MSKVPLMEMEWVGSQDTMHRMSHKAFLQTFGIALPGHHISNKAADQTKTNP